MEVFTVSVEKFLYVAAKVSRPFYPIIQSPKLLADTDFVREIFLILSFHKESQNNKVFKLTALLLALQFMKFAKIMQHFPSFLTKSTKPLLRLTAVQP